MEANDILIIADSAEMASFVGTLISKGKTDTFKPEDIGKIYQIIDGHWTNHAATIRTQDICDERDGKCTGYRIVVAMDTSKPKEDISMVSCLAEQADKDRVGYVAFKPGFGKIFGGDKEKMVSYINGNMQLHKGHSIITRNF